MFIIKIVVWLLDVTYIPSGEADVFIKAWEQEKNTTCIFTGDTHSLRIPHALSPYGWYGRCKFLPLSHTFTLTHTHTDT